MYSLILFYLCTCGKLFSIDPGNIRCSLDAEGALCSGLKFVLIQSTLYIFSLADSFIDVDNVVVSEDVDEAKKFHEEIDCLISVDLQTVEDDVVDATSTIPTHRFYSKTNRPKPRANVTIGLEELNAVKRKRRKKGPKLCMPTKRKRRRHHLTREYEEDPPDNICEFIPPVRHASVDSGVDMSDNVDSDLFTYGRRYKAVMDRVDYLPSRTLGKSSDTYMLSGRHVSIDTNMKSLPFYKNSATYKCPCCP